jgi:hypothetical protein
MLKIKFTDGEEIRIDGPFRTIFLPDGFYVVGGGDLIAVDNLEEGNELANKLRRTKEKAQAAATAQALGNEAHH